MMGPDGARLVISPRHWTRFAWSGRRPRRPPPWLLVAAAGFFLYGGLLVTGDLLRPVPSGLHASFDGHGAHVAAVSPSSPAERSGLRAGDRILTVGGRTVDTRLDWSGANANMVAGAPVALGIERAGSRLTISFTPERPAAGLAGIRPDTLALLAARSTQALCLVLALAVAFKRPDEPLARLTTWLLASLGVFTVLLPSGFAHYWRQVPLALHPLLWLAHLSSFAAPAIFFAFCAAFPRPLVSGRRALPWLFAPALLVVALHGHFAWVVVYREAHVALGADWSRSMTAINIGYVLAGLGALVLQYRRLAQPADRRRLRVLLAGAAVSFAAGGVLATEVLASRPSQFTSSLFESRVTLVAVPLLAALPASIAYTILRQRLFGIGVILRQGVRHALARRLLLSLVPVALAVIAVDLLLHQDEAVGAMLRLRAWRYALAGAVLATVVANRERWLAALDRRFFREQYRAEQILQEVAEHLRHASDPSEAVAAVVKQVDRALHPVFVGALGGAAESDALDVLAASPAYPERLAIGRHGRLAGLARAVGRPLELSPDQDTWIARHLPPAEATLVRETGLELVVPVSTGPAGELMLVLGPRRSEEPYSGRDLDLLGAIASNLALLIERTAPAAEESPSLAECPVCGACLDTSRARCPADGALLLVTGIPPVLGGRYRLLSRLGAGGMATVYGARDESLGRDVAVKVLGEHLVGNPDAARRFRLEAQTAATFTHPHVVTIHDFGVTPNNRAFIVMERLEGLTLREHLVAHGPLPPLRVLTIVAEVCDVLTVAHGMGLVHRDLKPENVFLATAGSGVTTKVLDFGIAKVMAGTSAPTSTFTSAGVLVGTLPYMSPEQLSGQPVHPMWDLWALAITSLEMLTGERPRGPVAVGQEGATPGTADVLRALPRGLAAFFAAALSADPRARPANAQGFRSGLARALDSS